MDRSLRDSLRGVVHYGGYEREDLPRLISEIRPSFSMITSVWPETYCHTLTESWLCGIPVIASEIGTLKERIDTHGGGWLLDYTKPDRWFRQMVDVSKDAAGYLEKLTEIEAMNFKSTLEMAAEYIQVYAKISGAS